MFQDPYDRTADSLMSPAGDCFAIAPSDSNDLPRATKAIYVGQTGDIALVPVRGSTAVIFRNVPAGTILDVRVRAIKASGTTSGDIVGLT